MNGRLIAGGTEWTTHTPELEIVATVNCLPQKHGVVWFGAHPLMM
jgi:hypothetical protein